jgi:hypothetical protein
LAAGAAIRFERRDDAARLLFPQLTGEACRRHRRRCRCVRVRLREHEMLGLDARRAVGEQQCALHYVFELAHVTGPGVRLQQGDGGRRNGHRLRGSRGDEAGRQGADVSGPLA